jgi:hypothetical protein
MIERGVTLDEINATLKDGRLAKDAKQGTYGKVWVFAYGREWIGRVFAEKEVSVYYKLEGDNLIVLTVKARYGDNFERDGNIHEI